MKKNKHILVLGAGVVGVTSAWYLREAGYEVTVIDRRHDVAEETSKANGGQISVSHAEPWANPSAPVQILKWLFDPNAPLKFQLSTNTTQLNWCVNFLRACQPKNTQENIKQLVTLGIYSRTCLQSLRTELNFDYQQKQKGILHFYTDTSMFERAKKSANFMCQLGCNREVLTDYEALMLEPNLASINGLIGATYTKNDESGNAHTFTQLLKQACKTVGVNFLFNTSIKDIRTQNDQVKSVTILHEGESNEVFADAYVMCLGSYSADIARKLNMPLMIYPAKGYSATYHVTDATKIPQTSLIDDAFKLVFSRFQTQSSDVLRVAGMAEIQHWRKRYDTSIQQKRADLITQRVQTLFPIGLDLSSPNYWTGLRPTTPSNVPYIGRSKLTNLYLNTGHGTLGWTHSCGSAKALSDIIQNKNPCIDFTFQHG